ncbi:MAG TPA: sensor domain-containing diguanylate cyclase [bacterium]|nr:sensor domain-containing diguanylate cyclase [bacterium]
MTAVLSPGGPGKIVGFLDRLAGEFTAVVNLSDFLQWIVRVLGEDLGYDSCAAALVNDRDPDVMVVGAASGLLVGLLGTTISAHRGVCGAVLRSGKPVFVPVPKRPTAAGAAACAARGAAYIPLAIRERVIGVLRVCRRPPGTLTDHDLVLLTAIVRYLGSALEVAYLHQQAKDISGTDALTGLANRRAFLDRIEAEMARARRSGGRVTIVLLDTNEFKAVNDAYGHYMGDRALIRVAEALVRNIRRSDLAVRYGGDEFLVVMPDTAMAQARRIIARIGVEALHVDVKDLPRVTLSMSWGAATWPDDAATTDGLLRVADARLYAMKRGRRSVPEAPPDLPAPVRASTVRRWARAVPLAVSAAAAALTLVAAGALFSGAGGIRHAVLAYRSGPAPAVEHAAVPSRPVATPRASLVPARGVPPAAGSGRRVVVVSGLLSVPAAARARAALAEIGLIPGFRHMAFAPDVARLFYGTFTSVAQARVLARRVRAAGYPAFVIVL